MIISSAMKKLFVANDCEPVERCVCLCDQGFQLQLWLDSTQRDDEKIEVESDLSNFITVYRVIDFF